MSQAAVEKALGKLLTDEGFRRRFFKDAVVASFAAGLELSRVELEALSRLSIEAVAKFSERLDQRICRLSLDEEERRRSPRTPRVRRRHPDERVGQGCVSVPETKEDQQ